jgi:hypothetical protein
MYDFVWTVEKAVLIAMKEVDADFDKRIPIETGINKGRVMRFRGDNVNFEIKISGTMSQTICAMQELISLLERSIQFAGAEYFDDAVRTIKKIEKVIFYIRKHSFIT